MENFLIILLIVMVVIIYSHLNNKIRKLENKISDLEESKTKKITHLPNPEEQKNTSPVFQPGAIQETPADLPSEIHSIRRRDWLSPVYLFFRQNTLAIIGIFTLVLGIGYFVKYAIDNNWIGESGRVGIGLLTGTAIIITGHFLRKNYAVFSSIILGGGIAVLYFTITIAFREYHLFSQSIAFIIVSIITITSIILSYYYKSEVLIIFSLLGGFLAPLMISSGQSNYLFLFTYLTVLNAGMLIIVFLKHWKSVGWIAFFITYAYLSYWTLEKTEFLSIYFYIINYGIFYAFALQDYLKKNTLSSFDILLLVLINFLNTLSLVYIFNKLDYEPAVLFPLVFAILNSCLILKEYVKGKFDTHYSVFTGITVSLVTIAIALQFKTHLITSIWAIEASLLLFIGKKTKIPVFKSCFYILFPLVVIAQIITWSQYFNSKQLTIIFNPVFLTSFVTIITTAINLVLLKQIPDRKQTQKTIPEALLQVVSYAIIYFALLFELLYQVPDKPNIIFFISGTLFSIYYIFLLLALGKKLEISNSFKTGLIYSFLMLIIIHISFSGSELITTILLKKVSPIFYSAYLLYLPPFIYLYWRLISNIKPLPSKITYWFVSFTLISVISYELYHLYILGNVRDFSNYHPLQKHFITLYLPVIWAILASIFIYIGLKKDHTELNRIGFTLIGLMIIKLYAYDIWQMDNISRIIAFILLGIILLLSSFMFQRLKNIIRNMVDNKDKGTENKNSNL